jgi:hypothetical protein
VGLGWEIGCKVMEKGQDWRSMLRGYKEKMASPD